MLNVKVLNVKVLNGFIASLLNCSELWRGVLNEPKANFMADIIGVTSSDTDDSRKPAMVAQRPNN